MQYKSNFSFLKGKKGFKDIFNISKQFEKSIINQCFNAALMAGRLVSELLLIKISLQDDYIRNNLLIKKNSQWQIKKDVSVDNIIWKCYKSHDVLFDKEIKEKFFLIKNMGNLNAHGININKYGLNQCKEMHKLLYDVAVNSFKQFYDVDIEEYNYNLDKVNINKRFTSDEIFNYLNNIHENEINTKNFIEYIESKKIFFTKEYFDEIIHQYRDDLTDKGNFESELEKTKWIDDSNIQIFLQYFSDSTKKEIYSKLTQISEQNLSKILEILNKQPDYLTISSIDKMLADEKGSEKVYFNHIKKLSDNFFSNSLNGIINELKSVLVEETSEETKEIINKLKNYRTDFDDYGFTINQVEENIFLDDDQNDAVKYDGNKPLIINAGPGSGKTRVITERVRFLVEEKKVDPDSILVITFTNEATNELKNRLKYETDLDINVVNQMRISTIHSFCRFLISKYEDIPYNYLSRYGERSLFVSKHQKDLGFYGPYNILGTDLPNVLKKYDHYFSFGIKTDEFANHLIKKNKITNDYINFVNDYLDKTNGKYPTYNQIVVAKKTNPHYYAKYLKIVESYPKYKELLEENKSCDDNYLLEKGYQVLSNVEIDYTNILIDEFQDTDYHLNKIVKLLEKNSETFTIVGDLDQSIYGFRGGCPKYFKEYLDDDINNKCVTLHNNYRSTRDIVEFSEEFIKGKRDFDKSLNPIKQYNSQVYHLSNYEETDEFHNLIYIIKDLKKKNKIKYYSDILVLFKSHLKIDNFVKELELFDVPYHIDSKQDFLEQNEIKAILTLYWYLLDFDEFNLNYNKNKKTNDVGNNFLNFYGFTDELYDSSDFFKLSDETKQVLTKIQKEYEQNIIYEANKLYYNLYRRNVTFDYIDVFDQNLEFIQSVVNNVEKENLIELDEIGLIKLGIENKKDRDFFLKLRNLKFQMNSENYRERPTTLKLFKEFITMTNFYSEISLKDSDEAIRLNKDISLLSNIIKDYENIMGNKNYYGLFNYLNKVLKSYSSSSSELEDEMDKVHIKTIHKAKGLEYPIVIIGSLGKVRKSNGKLSYSFPSLVYYDDSSRYEDFKSIDSYPFQTPIRFLERKPKDYNSFVNCEEYRKIYVGVTRAKEVLILSTIGEAPTFIDRIKRSEVHIESLNPFDDKIKKIESSKIINKRNLIPELNFEKILKDYLFCKFRYNLSNNLKLELDVSDNNYVDMVAHNLLENIHSQHIMKSISNDEVDEKVRTCIELQNISSNETSLRIIENIIKYWENTGSKYKILHNNIPIAFSLENCELNGNIDLIIKGRDENKISIVQFISTDKRISDDSALFYQMLCHFYPFCLKEYDEFKDKKIENIILYSLNNNNARVFDYEEIYEKQALEFLESITTDIINSKFEKNKDSCSNCEYNYEFCKNKT